MKDAQLQELWDREMIRECLYRYCRAADRMDEASLQAVYWPGARDRHGSFDGPAAQFVEWARKLSATLEAGTHQVTNIIIEFQPGGAAVESYFTALQRQRLPDGLIVDHLCGRYLDWFEKRGEEWRIADRLVVFDWYERSAPTPGAHPDRFLARTPVGSKFPDDPVYALLKRGAPAPVPAE